MARALREIEMTPLIARQSLTWGPTLLATLTLGGCGPGPIVLPDEVGGDSGSDSQTPGDDGPWGDGDGPWADSDSGPPGDGDGDPTGDGDPWGDGDGDTGPDCPVGSFGCPCDSGVCDTGLVCTEDNLCELGGGDGDGDGDGFNCDALPSGPLNFTVKWGPRATEDFAMTHDGYIIGADNGNLFRSPYNGDPELILPGAGGFITGLRALSNGDIVFGDHDANSLNLFAGGEANVILGGLAYPNGIEIGLDDMVYVAEQNANRVRRVDPYSGANEIVATGTDSANGVTFSPAYDVLYVGSFGGGSISKMSVNGQGQLGPAQIFIDDDDGAPVGWGLDGMGVDACGNVYVCQYVEAVLWRISPDGQDFEVIVNLGSDVVLGVPGGDETQWIPNFQWGSGVGGWDEYSIYLLDISGDKMYEIPAGVPQKPRNYP